jgi:arginyl-tRNA synthetase
VITRDLRHAIARAAAAAGFNTAGFNTGRSRQTEGPGLRPTGIPGQYAASIALTLGGNPRETAQNLGARLADEPWIATAEVTGPGYLTITITPDALAAVADNITAAGPACVTSDALAGVTLPAAPPGDPLAAATWEEARAKLAARLTARLAAAAGASVPEAPAPASEVPPYMSGAPRRDIYGNFTISEERPGGVTDAVRRVVASGESPSRSADQHSALTSAGHGQETDVARAPAGRYGGSSPREAIAFAGRDAVTFTLARAIPSRPLRIDPEIIARHVLGNPAYAVRYAHARAASGLRWGAISSAADTIGSGEAPQFPLVGSGPELVVPEAGADKMAVCAIGSGLRNSGGYGGSPPRETTALLDALSWLPERVATAARRGRPDEFARYLEDLASITIDVLSSASRPGSVPGSNAAPGSDRLALAMAARTGLAAGLGLLEVAAPERL